MVTSASTPGLVVMNVICFSNLKRTVQVSELLVDPHLKMIPNFRTFTTRSFPCSDFQSRGRHPKLAFYFEILLCPSDQVADTFSKDFTLCWLE